MFHPFFSFRYAQSRALFLVFLACLYLGLHGQMPKSSAGWVLPLHSPLQVAPLRRLTVGLQRRLSRRKERLNQYNVVCRNSAIQFMQQHFASPLLRALALAVAFSFFAEQLLILSLVPLLVWLMKGLSWLRPELIKQPEWLTLFWLLSWVEYALILMSGAFVFFEFALDFAHQNQLPFSPETTPLVLLLNQTASLSSDENTRLQIAQKMAALAVARELNPEASRRQIAQTLGIPESTLRHWEQRQEQIQAPEEVVAFFESPAGVLFLHRLLVASQFMMAFVSPTGVRNLSLFLELSGLSPFVASSYGAQRQMVMEMEAAIVAFGEQEEKRLVAQMPQKEVALAEDENFQQGLCLVAIEPVSDFILAEKYSSDRSADSWTTTINERLEAMPVHVNQVTSDEAKGIVHHVEKDLQAHHSPDLFHILQELVKATSRALSRKVTQAYEKLQELENTLEQLTKKQEAFLSISASELNNPSAENLSFRKFAAQLEQEVKQLTEQKQDAQAKWQAAFLAAQEAKELIKRISHEYHPYNLETGQSRSPEELHTSLKEIFAQLTQLAKTAQLSDSAHRRILKASRLIGKMVATQNFYFKSVKAKVEVLTLQEEVEQAIYNQLIPALYLDLVASKAKTARQRQEFHQKSQQLLETLKAENNCIWQLSNDELELVLKVALECAQLFQRSSSCVEGRNGQLSLRHHNLHRISNRKLNALTVIHNYFLKRHDGTTAAERFFASKPKELFDYLLTQMPLPPRPARKRKNPRTKNYLTLLMD